MAKPTTMLSKATTRLILVLSCCLILIGGPRVVNGAAVVENNNNNASGGADSDSDACIDSIGNGAFALAFASNDVSCAWVEEDIERRCSFIIDHHNKLTVGEWFCERTCKTCTPAEDATPGTALDQSHNNNEQQSQLQCVDYDEVRFVITRSGKEHEGCAFAKERPHRRCGQEISVVVNATGMKNDYNNEASFRHVRDVCPLSCDECNSKHMNGSSSPKNEIGNEIAEAAAAANASSTTATVPPTTTKAPSTTTTKTQQQQQHQQQHTPLHTCKDYDGWSFELSNENGTGEKRSCDWVKEDPETRCDVDIVTYGANYHDHGETSSRHIRQYCAKTCGACSPNIQDPQPPQTASSNLANDNKKSPAAVAGAKEVPSPDSSTPVATAAVTASSAAVECKDYDDSRFELATIGDGNIKVFCDWAQMNPTGRCDLKIVPSYIKLGETEGHMVNVVSEHCPRTCGVCVNGKDDDEAKINATPPVDATVSASSSSSSSTECKDIEPSATCHWAKDDPAGRCYEKVATDGIDGTLVRDYCKRTCGVCDDNEHVADKNTTMSTAETSNTASSYSEANLVAAASAGAMSAIVVILVIVFAAVAYINYKAKRERELVLRRSRRNSCSGTIDFDDEKDKINIDDDESSMDPTDRDTTEHSDYFQDEPSEPSSSSQSSSNNQMRYKV